MYYLQEPVSLCVRGSLEEKVRAGYWILDKSTMGINWILHMKNNRYYTNLEILWIDKNIKLA